MIKSGSTDEQVTSAFEVHRTTIGRLRRHLEGDSAPPGRLAAPAAFRQLVQADCGPMDDDHHDEYCARRDAALARWRRDYFNH